VDRRDDLCSLISCNRTVKAQIAQLLFRAVTGDAVIEQNGSDFCLKMLVGTLPKWLWLRNRRQHQNARSQC
jgi:hypothetical protein